MTHALRSLIVTATLAGTMVIAASPASAMPSATASDPPRVVLYGDSLAWEAQTHFVAVLDVGLGADVVARTFGGTALCDFLDQMREDVRSSRPRAAVLEFSGNRFTPCMHHADGSPMDGGEAFLKYLADAREAIDVFASTGTVVYLAGAPVRRENDGTVQGGAMNALYRWLALLEADDGVEFVDAGQALLRDGRYTDRLPCLPDDRCDGDDGTNPVRSPDGLHLCPAEMWSLKSPSPECPVWSSGAYRYGLALAAPVLARLFR